MDKPLISVIIPVKNGTNYLGEALESLRRQSLNLEIIVVDDGSTDATAELAEKAGCIVLRHPVSRGQVAAKNTGIAAAKSDFILFLDHDDRVRDGALRTMLDALQAAPEASAVQAMVKDFRSPEIPDLPGILVRPEPFYGLFTGAILIRREVFDRIGPFSENVHAGEIIEWFSRVEAIGGKVIKLDLVSTDRRIHQTNFGRTDRQEEMKNYAAVLRERLKALRSQDLPRDPGAEL
ncbi:MAG: glycosyltransferase family 2 protein [Bacteroidales bacterium]|nr:glycosyltransferase family 2 protein [Bacteroidales bacterium]